jgi:hypothetical protein
MENSIEAPQKTKNMPYDPVIPILMTYSKE